MKLRVLTIPALMIVLATSAQECETTLKSCDFRPELDVRRGGIVGKARAVCNVPPEIHNFDLWLEVLNTSDEWRVIRHTSSTRIPGKSKGVKLTVKASCEEGHYRVKGKATGVLEGNNFQFKDDDVKFFTEGDCQMG